jgi:very-short-patch-repair endonuclease
MPALAPALADYLSSRHGVTSTAELLAFGHTRSQIARLVDVGVLVPVFRGVYRLRTAPDTLHARARAASLPGSTNVVTGRAGGRIYGVRRMGKVDVVEVRAPHFANTLDAPWVRLRRCNAMPAVDIVERDDGIRIVSIPRLVFDLAADLSPLDLESVAEQVIDEGWCTAATLIDTGRRLYHPARPGAKQFLLVMESRPKFAKPADSHLEVVLHDALRRAGVRGLVGQYRLDLPGGWAIHADYAIPALRWAIAVDHRTWHGGAISGTRDKQNDRMATRIGWTVSRVGDLEITEQLDSTVADLVEIYDLLRRRAAS